MQKIVVASNNAGKLREIRSILEPFGFETLSQKQVGYELDVEETGTTFQENAAIKAQAVFDALHCAVIADDSGLVVDALDGAPGIYSHRFAGADATDAQRNNKLLEMLKDMPTEKRMAHFICAICYMDENGKQHFFEGKCEGIIGTQLRGENGFGYDPLFYVGGKSMAEYSAAEKNQMSHRAEALRQLEKYLERSLSIC
ncbi:MAG: XTP/dITP diphosphatase [Ruminococcus sp.]|nr:XTP/dITP diphosphatase [Ruminococcus sp.]